MLAKADELPLGRGWQYEVKWDGVRCTATVSEGRVAMQSRSAKTDYAKRYPQIAAQLAQLYDGVYDGELVTLDENGETFGLSRGSEPALVLFDVIESEGHDQRGRPLSDRRELLEAILAEFDELDRLVLSPVFYDGEALLEWAEQRGIEGIMAKRRSSRYREGSRTGDWVKVKVRPEQEFVVCGWTDGKGSRRGRIGGLVLGYYDDSGALVYCGRAGCRTDHDQRIARALSPRATAPFERGVPKEERDAHWCEPELVVQVAFQRWTDDGRLWHPSFKRIRDDKEPRDVGRAA